MRPPIEASVSAFSNEIVDSDMRPRAYRLHHGLGTYLRNRYRHGGLLALFRWSRSQLAEVNHLDDLSEPILYEIWRVLRTPVPEIRGRGSE
jgi:hypothetical protein